MGVSTVRSKAALIVLVVLVMLLPATAGGKTDVGTLDNPVKLSFRVGDETGVQILASALHEATGLEFSVASPASSQAAVAWMCITFPDSGMRIAYAAEYILIDQECGADTRHKLIRFGSSTYATEFLVPDDSDLYTLEDLAGLDWYFREKESISGYMVPLGMLKAASVEAFQEIETGSDREVVQAVYDNSVSDDALPVFATVFVDARYLIEGDYPDVYDEVRVLVESPPLIPHAPVVFGPEFPANLRRQIEKALVPMSDPENPFYDAWDASLGEWYFATGLEKAKKKDFNFLRAAMEAAGIGIGDF